MKKIKYIIVLFIWPALFINSQNAEIDSLVQIGYNKIEQKDYNGSLVEFEKALKIDKTDESAVTGKINALIFLDNIKEASDYVEENINKYSDYSIFYYSRGLLSNYKKQYKKAIEDFDKALELDNKGNLKKIYISRGIAYENLKEFDDAILDLSAYIQHDNTNINALYHRGFNYYQIEDYNEAIDDFNEVVKLDDKNGYAFYNLGMAYFRTNDLLNACKNFQIACQLNNINACKMILTGCAKKNVY